MKKTPLFFTLLFISLATFAQEKSKYIQVGGAFGSSNGSINISGQKDWYLGKKNRIIIGTGLRFTSFFGKNVTFITAPAKFTTDDKSIDSLLAPKPALYSLNAMINLGYKISDKLEVGFNIDALGLSFGPEGSPSFISNKKSTVTKAKPTSPNTLLVGDNDRGSLNSQFYARYKLNNKIGLNLAYQYLFNELTTITKVQTVPEANDRFRAKSSQIYVGISYHF
jgi:long-subunit fatty acid transport protein